LTSRYPPPEPDYDGYEAEDDTIRISRRAALAGAAGVVAAGAAAVLFILLRDGDEDDDDPDDGALAGTPTEAPTEIPTEIVATDTPQPPVPTDTPAEAPTATPEASPTAESTPTPEPSPTDAPPTETPDPTPTITPPAPTATPVPPPAPGWNLLEPAGEPPAARRDHSLVADRTGERVYLFGGRAGSQALQDLWVYDVPGNRWILVEPGGGLPPARFGHNAIYDVQQQLVVIFGGQAGSTFFNDVWIYDPVANVWAMLEAGDEDGAPLARYGAGSAAREGGGAFFISHGFTTDGRFDDTWLYDLQAGQWTDVSPTGSQRPLPRCLMRLAADPERERLLLFGGQSNTAAYLGDLWAFDTVSHGWEELDLDNPPARNLYSLARRSDSGDLILFGGASADGALADTWSFGVEDDEWDELVDDDDPVILPRDSHDAVWLNGQAAMLVFGGRGEDGMLNDLWLFVP
jgi:hypothetical protein